MKTYTLLFVAALAALNADGSAKQAPLAPVTSPQPTLSEPVLAAWAKAEYRFTPEVKAAYLSWSKSLVLAAIAKAGQKLPADFLNWVDSDPVVAETVYGI